MVEFQAPHMVPLTLEKGNVALLPAEKDESSSFLFGLLLYQLGKVLGALLQLP